MCGWITQIELRSDLTSEIGWPSQDGRVKKIPNRAPNRLQLRLSTGGFHPYLAPSRQGQSTTYQYSIRCTGRGFGSLANQFNYALDGSHFFA